MNILSRIIARIWTDLYPKVEAVVGKVEAAADRAADKARGAAEELAAIVTDSPAARRTQEEILDSFAALLKDEGGDDLSNWRQSIIDLLKLVGIESSIANRRDLAREVGIVGYEPTGAMNVELSKRVLAKLRRP